jgi:hypothetical protein
MNRKSARRSTAGVKVFVASASLAATVGGWAALSVANAGQLQQPILNVPTTNSASPGFGQSPLDDANGDQLPIAPQQIDPQQTNPNFQQVAPNQFNNSFPQPFRRTHSSR